MITWMQRHKKWLVITLWISVIAFVGAGFVGWGRYEYGKSSSTIAKVGNRNIDINDIQNEYNTLYNQYLSVYGNRFNAEVAKQLHLKQIALDRAIQNARLLNFADELGLMTTDQELAQNLINTPQFQKNGKFDKKQYLLVLSQNRLNPKDYENNLKKSILLSKTAKIFQSQANKSEIECLNSVFNLKDKVEIYILDSKNFKIKLDPTQMKNFWENNKDRYKSKSSLEFNIYKVNIVKQNFDEKTIKKFYLDNKTLFRNSEGKLKNYTQAKQDVIKKLESKATKTEALKKYIDLKKSKIKFITKQIYYTDNLPFDLEDTKKINMAKINQVLKPIKLKDGSYIILQLIKKHQPKLLSFKEAKSLMRDDFIRYQKIQLLSKKTQKAIKDMKQQNLKTIKLGFISRNSIDALEKIKQLQPAQSIEFLNKLFSTTDNSIGAIELQSLASPKTIIYHIIEQKLATKNKDTNTMLKDAITQIKNNLIFSNLLNKLEYRYETHVFSK